MRRSVPTGSDGHEQCQECPVSVSQHEPDPENLVEEIHSRVMELLESERPPLLYANPICTITCLKPTPEFFREVRRHQAQWCQRAIMIFGRKPMRSVKNWPLDPATRKQPRWKRRYIQFLIRGYAVTGLLLVNGRPMPSDQWPESLHEAN